MCTSTNEFLQECESSHCVQRESVRSSLTSLRSHLGCRIMWLLESALALASQKATITSTDFAGETVCSRTVDIVTAIMPQYMQHLIGWLAVCTAASPYVSVPSSVPADASSIVDPDFAGFAFEQASLWNYALDLDGNPNVFSQNLIAEITKRTGGKPLIRLGGTR